jgi:hypothetical protein
MPPAVQYFIVCIVMPPFSSEIGPGEEIPMMTDLNQPTCSGTMISLKLAHWKRISRTCREGTWLKSLSKDLTSQAVRRLDSLLLGTIH